MFGIEGENDIIYTKIFENSQASSLMPPSLYYHKDYLGSVDAVTDDQGEVLESYHYGAYGETSIYDVRGKVVGYSQIGNDYRYTGQRFDEETGLYYYKARYYSSEIGRFLQRDPVGYVDSYNLYAYVGNNPINYVDPFGLEKNLGMYGFVENFNNFTYGLVHSISSNFTFGITGVITEEPEGIWGGIGSRTGDAISVVVGIMEMIGGVGTLVGGITGGLGVSIFSGGIGAVAGGAIAGGSILWGGGMILHGGGVVYKAGNSGGSLKSGGSNFKISNKIAKQMKQRGWTEKTIAEAINNPYKTKIVRDKRYMLDGSRLNDPATAYIRADGHYVVVNDTTGDIVQISNLNKLDWKPPW